MAAIGIDLAEIPSNLDPRLCMAIENARSGVETNPTASSMRGEIPVIALVKNKESWIEHPDVRAGTIIGRQTTGEFIVTGRISARYLADVHSNVNIINMISGRSIHAQLHDGVPNINAVAANLNLVGRMADGVVVGIIDFGCDFAHKNLCSPNGTTRLEAIWDQAAPDTVNQGVDYGCLHRRPAIDAALQKSDPYVALNYPVGGVKANRWVNEDWTEGTHGTHVSDIAAGNGNGTGTSGVAADATLIFVESSSVDVAWSGPEVVGSNFGNSVQLLEAVRWIFDQAGDRPCVINMSLGTNGGAHDGNSLVEVGIDAMVTERPNRAVVIAASNSYRDHIHASGVVRAGKFVDLPVNVPKRSPKTRGHCEVEVWYGRQHRLDLEMIDPSGQSSDRLKPGTAGSVNDDAGKSLVFVASQIDDPTNGDNTIGIFLEADRVPTGQWGLRLHNDSAVDIPFHAWIERNDGGQANFSGPLMNDDFTLGSISCGRESIVVGSYDAHKATTPLSSFSSAGPTRDGRQKPEVSGPGNFVKAARSLTGNATTVMSGTSMAAPMVTGAIAVLLSEAHRRNVPLNSAAIRNIVTSSARSAVNPPGWHNRYGFGRVDLQAMLRALPAATAVSVAPAAAVSVAAPVAAAPVIVGGQETAGDGTFS